ncbi:MAG: hypothetical protein PUF39_06165 [Prevotellaceae bacterium]|nr:hypothetical protein [Prevotellaceae bacterium]
MKKSILSIIALCVCVMAFAQEKTLIKAGTIIPLQAVQTVKAADLCEGQTVDFVTVSPLTVDGKNVFESGTIVKGKVVEAKKSTIAGTKGRLVISIQKMLLPNGSPLFFSDTTVRIYGKNKTPLAVVLGCFVWPCIFIPGSKAQMPQGYEVEAMVASNTEYSM